MALTDLQIVAVESGVSIGANGLLSEDEAQYFLDLHPPTANETPQQKADRLRVVASEVCDRAVARLQTQDARVKPLTEQARYLRTIAGPAYAALIAAISAGTAPTPSQLEELRAEFMAADRVVLDEADANIATHNTEDGRHTPDLDPIRSSLVTINQTLAALEAEAGDIALVQGRFTDVADGGVKLQLTHNGGGAWVDVPGLHAMGLALQHEVPTLPGWLDGGFIPTTQLAQGPRSSAAVPVLHLAGGVYTARWTRLPGMFYWPETPAFTAVEGADAIVNRGGGARPEWYEYTGNAWHRRFTFPDHRFHAGTNEPSNLLGDNGEYYLRHNGTNAVSFWLKNGGVWGKLCDFGQGGGGGGLTPEQATAIANARIAALVLATARTGNTNPWQATKLGSGNAANRFLRSDGNNGIWTEVPNWIWQAAVRITAGKMGASAGDARTLHVHNNVPTWRTNSQLVAVLAGDIWTALAAASDEITVDNAGHITVAAAPTAAQLAGLFKAGEARVDPDDASKVDIIFPAGGDVTLPLGFFREIERPGTNEVGFWRLGTVKNNGNDGTALAIGGWATSNDGWSISNANVINFKAVIDQIADDIYLPGLANPRFSNIRDNPFLVGDHSTTAVEEDQLLIDENNRYLYRAAGSPAHGASWVLRAYGTTDLGAGQSFEGYVDTYQDLPTVGLEDGDVYFVRAPDGFGPWVWVASTSSWGGISERFYGSHAYPNEASALREVSVDYPNDDDFNGHHVVYGRPALAYTCTDYTAPADSTLRWERYDAAILSELHTLRGQLEPEVLHTSTGGTRLAVNYSWANDLKFEFDRALVEADDDRNVQFELNFITGAGANAQQWHETYTIPARQFRSMAVNALTTGTTAPPDAWMVAGARLTRGAARDIWICRNRTAGGNDILRFYRNGSGNNLALSSIEARITLRR